MYVADRANRRIQVFDYDLNFERYITGIGMPWPCKSPRSTSTAATARSILGIAYLLAFLTRWIINALLLVLTDKLMHHLHIDGFGSTLGAALMMSILGTIGEWVVRAIV